MKRKTRKGRKTEMMRMMMAFGFAAIVASSAALAGTNNVDIVAAARRQIGVTVGYDSAYVRLAYPLTGHYRVKQ